MSDLSAGLYPLEKSVWTEADLERMNWHDTHIHGVLFQSESEEVIFDVDYLLSWVKQEPPASQFQWWLSPATLVFKNVERVSCDLEELTYSLQILSLGREEIARNGDSDRTVPNKRWMWNLWLVSGNIAFSASGFTLFLRRQPRLLDDQHIPLEERDGVSFERTPSL